MLLRFKSSFPALILTVLFFASCVAKKAPDKIAKIDYDFSPSTSVSVKLKDSSYRGFETGYISKKTFYGRSRRGGDEAIHLKKIDDFEFTNGEFVSSVKVHYYPKKIKSTFQNFKGCIVKADSKDNLARIKLKFDYKIKKDPEEWKTTSIIGAYEWLFGKKYKKRKIFKSAVFDFKKLKMKKNSGLCDSRKIEDSMKRLEFSLSKKRVKGAKNPTDQFNIHCVASEEVDFSEDIYMDVDLLGRITNFKYVRKKMQPNGEDPIEFVYSCAADKAESKMNIPKSWFGF